MNALMVAARGGHESCVEVLVASGVQVTDCTCMCMTALHFAALVGSRNIVNRLVTAGATVDARNAKGGTALMIAAEEGCCGVVEELLLSGAEPSLTDKYGSTMVCIAQRKGSWPALRRLWNAVPVPVTQQKEALVERPRPCTPPLKKPSNIWESQKVESGKVRVSKVEEEDPVDAILFAHVDVLLMS
jgi:ankyrin repeat protein